jgi:hypothetical protein
MKAIALANQKVWARLKVFEKVKFQGQRLEGQGHGMK